MENRIGTGGSDRKLFRKTLFGNYPGRTGSKKQEGGEKSVEDFFEADLGSKNDMMILYYVLCIQRFHDDTRVSFYDVNYCG